MLPLIIFGLVALAASSTSKSKKEGIGRIYKSKSEYPQWKDDRTRKCKDGTFSDAQAGACARHGGLASSKRKQVSQKKVVEVQLKKVVEAQLKEVRTLKEVEAEIMAGRNVIWERKKGKDLFSTFVENKGDKFEVTRIRNGKQYSKGSYSAEKFEQNIKRSVSGIKKA